MLEPWLQEKLKKMSADSLRDWLLDRVKADAANVRGLSDCPAAWKMANEVCELARTCEPERVLRLYEFMDGVTRSNQRIRLMFKNRSFLDGRIEKPRK